MGGSDISSVLGSVTTEGMNPPKTDIEQPDLIDQLKHYRDKISRMQGYPISKIQED
jgi:hypothetical protein